jgi:uncharacterized protein YndB with AHSA1/START domain
MTARSTEHTSFILERRYALAPARVFAAWSDPAAKARWFVGPDNWRLIAHELDFCMGGHERLHGAFSGGPETVYQGHYHDIVPDERIVYSYEMSVDGRRISVSLATVEFKVIGAGTRLMFAEQALFLDGFQDGGGRKRGSASLLDQLGRSLID